MRNNNENTPIQNSDSKSPQIKKQLTSPRKNKGAFLDKSEIIETKIDTSFNVDDQ